MVKDWFWMPNYGPFKKIMMGVLYVVAVFKLRFVFLDVFIHNKCSYTEMKNIVGNICCNAPFLGRCYLLSIWLGEGPWTIFFYWWHFRFCKQNNSCSIFTRAEQILRLLKFRCSYGRKKNVPCGDKCSKRRKKMFRGATIHSRFLVGYVIYSVSAILAQFSYQNCMSSFVADLYA